MFIIIIIMFVLDNGFGICLFYFNLFISNMLK